MSYDDVETSWPMVTSKAAVVLVGYLIGAVVLNSLAKNGALSSKVIERLAPIYGVSLFIALMPTIRRCLSRVGDWKAQYIVAGGVAVIIAYALVTTQPMYVDGFSLWQLYAAVSILPLLMTTEIPPAIEDWIERKLEAVGVVEA